MGQGGVEMVLGGFNLSLHLVRFQATRMAKVLFKRTTPFNKGCGFIMSDLDGEIEVCQEEADFGLYFRLPNASRVSMVSLCHYHLIFQESEWIGGRE